MKIYLLLPYIALDIYAICIYLCKVVLMLMQI